MANQENQFIIVEEKDIPGRDQGQDVGGIIQVIENLAVNHPGEVLWQSWIRIECVREFASCLLHQSGYSCDAETDTMSYIQRDKDREIVPIILCGKGPYKMTADLAKKVE